MKFAIVNKDRKEPFKKGKGLCISCGREMIAKCGSKTIHHWAHMSLKNCDTWWENETEWHRAWKSKFPSNWQEVVFSDKTTGEKHIADVQTKSGVILEFQNSPISTEELKSREEFYDKLVWIINGQKFINNFHILHKLPNPKDEYFKDIAFINMNSKQKGISYYKYSEETPGFNMVRIYSIKSIQNEIDKSYIGHHQYDWIKPRSVWFESVKRVFIDFNDDLLWELKVYDNKGLKCIQAISKRYFLKRATG